MKQNVETQQLVNPHIMLPLIGMHTVAMEWAEKEQKQNCLTHFNIWWRNTKPRNIMSSGTL